jgi:S-adenosylmethionine synthetase
MNANVTLRAAEWVLPGHPDKLADAVADALVQAAQERQPEALCAIEVAVHREQVFLTGRLACEGAEQLPLSEIVQGVYRSAGYGPSALEASLADRASGMRQTVGHGPCALPRTTSGWPATSASSLSFPAKSASATSATTSRSSPATRWTCPASAASPEQWLAREVARRLFALVHTPLLLCPDGKVLVVLEEELSSSNVPTAWRLHSVSCSLLAQAGDVELHRAAAQAVREAAHELARRLPGFEASDPHELVVNGSGTFAIGGPEGDNGLSGKKLLLDHYGPRVPIGGTALERQGLLEARSRRHATRAAHRAGRGARRRGARGGRAARELSR